jgi:RNA polymerase sigma-32 factor
MPQANCIRPTSTRSLDREEEVALLRRVKLHADGKAADRLMRAHLPHVTHAARKYFRYGVPMNDLIAEGNFGLVHALRKFDPERGVRFATYAQHWVRAYMVGHVLKTWSVVNSGSTVLRTRWFFRLRRERARMAGPLDSGGTAERDLASRMGVKPEELRSMLQHLDSRDVSLDTPAAPDSPLQFVDVLPAADDPERSFLTEQANFSLAAAVKRALATLDPRERYIAERRLMADTNEMLTLTDVGRALGVSRVRARQLEDRAARKMRARIASFGDATVHESLALKEQAAARRVPLLG